MFIICRQGINKSIHLENSQVVPIHNVKVAPANVPSLPQRWPHSSRDNSLRAHPRPRIAPCARVDARSAFVTLNAPATEASFASVSFREMIRAIISELKSVCV